MKGNRMRTERMSASKVVMKIVSMSFSLLVLLVVCFGIYRVGQAAYQFGYRVFTEPPVASESEGKDKVVQIKDDMSAKEIGELLESKGLIEDANLFYVQLKLSAYAKSIQPGAYTLSTSMTAKEMMRVMSAVEEESTEE